MVSFRHPDTGDTFTPRKLYGDGAHEHTRCPWQRRPVTIPSWQHDNIANTRTSQTMMAYRYLVPYTEKHAMPS